jgi:hypothetical protein
VIPDVIRLSVKEQWEIEKALAFKIELVSPATKENIKRSAKLSFSVLTDSAYTC